MASAFINEHALRAIQGFRPFLGPRGSGCVEILENLSELMSSEPAEKTKESLRILGFEEPFKTLDAVSSELTANPFTLFLILILLLLADDGVAPRLETDIAGEPEPDLIITDPEAPRL